MDPKEESVPSADDGGKTHTADSDSEASSKPTSQPSDQPESQASSAASKKVDDELDPELDALLDDALADFDKPPPLPPTSGLDAAAYHRHLKKGKPAAPASSTSTAAPKSVDDVMNSAWSEEFIREATSQFEKNMRELLAQTPGPPSGPSAGPSASRVDAGGDTLHKVIEAAASAALSGTDSSATPDGIAASLNEAIKNIKQHTSAAEGQMPFSDDELSKLMESMGIGMAMGEGEVDDAALNSFLPEMTKMMQKLLSKEILDPVLTELVDRYPDWLADNREKITSAKYEKYNQQYEYMKRICQEYAQEKETDSLDMKAKRFDRISDLMLKVQYIGPPPSELVGEMDAAGLAALDPSATPCTIM